jgi:hypothetical protein
MSALTPHVAIVPDSPSITLADVSPVAAAIQKQATRDFGPIWQVNATVDSFAKLEDVPVDYWPVIIRDDIEQPGAAGYHTDDHGQPFSLVQADAGWELTVSHETLEMLADPFGNRTIAGSLPPKAPKEVADFTRVIYLVEVCDPCEDTQFAYGVNGINLSDFITPHYYDPSGASGVQYSFRGNIKAPHTVLDGGYVSFGNPVDNNWYQIIVEGGKQQVRDLGVIKTGTGKSLREQVDAAVRQSLRDRHYRTKAAAFGAAASGGRGTLRHQTVFAESSAARAKSLRNYVSALK